MEQLELDFGAKKFRVGVREDGKIVHYELEAQSLEDAFYMASTVLKCPLWVVEMHPKNFQH